MDSPLEASAPLTAETSELCTLVLIIFYCLINVIAIATLFLNELLLLVTAAVLVKSGDFRLSPWHSTFGIVTRGNHAFSQGTGNQPER